MCEPRLEYAPLDESTGEIRVLSILPCSDDCSDTTSDTLRCTLEHVSLYDYTEEYWACRSIFEQLEDPKESLDESWYEHVRLELEVLDPAPSPISIIQRYFRFNWGDYVALSYTWGDQSRKKAIIVDATETNIGQNLEEALRGEYLSGVWEMSVHSEVFNIGDTEPCQ